MNQKYSFIEFLSKPLFLDNDQKSSVIIDKVEIPIIQRDYAQGRLKTNKEDKNKKTLNETGKRFIKTIFEHLENGNEPIYDIRKNDLRHKEQTICDIRRGIFINKKKHFPIIFSYTFYYLPLCFKLRLLFHFNELCKLCAYSPSADSKPGRHSLFVDCSGVGAGRRLSGESYKSLACCCVFLVVDCSFKGVGYEPCC